MKLKRIFWGFVAALILLSGMVPLCTAAESGEFQTVIGTPEDLSQELSNQVVDLSACYLASGAVRTVQQQSEFISPVAGEVLLMTALLTAENTNRDDVVTIPDQAPWPDHLKKTAGLKARDTLTTEDLLAEMLLTGAEDCAYALAYYVSGSVDAFVQQMNEKARQLGMEQTVFTNPAGESDENAVTTVDDLMRLIREVGNNARLAEALQMQQYTNSDGKEISNQSSMMDESARTYDNRVAGMLYGGNDTDGFRTIVFSAVETRGIAFFLQLNPAQSYEHTIGQVIDSLFETTEEIEISDLVAQLAQELTFEKEGAKGTVTLGVDQIVAATVATGMEPDASDFSLTMIEDTLPERPEIGGPAGIARLSYQGQWVTDVDLAVRTLKQPSETLLNRAEPSPQLTEALHKTQYGWIFWSAGAVLLGGLILAAAAIYKRFRSS